MGELMITCMIESHRGKPKDDAVTNLNIRIIVVVIVLGFAVIARFVLPCSISHNKEYARDIIVKAVEEQNFHKLNVINLEFIPNRELPQEENWDAGAYRVVTSLKDSDVQFVNYVDCNIVHDPYAKKSVVLSEYADQLKVADHSLTSREIMLLKEYSRLCDLPVEDFSYDGSAYKTGVGEWSVWPESGPGYHFYFENNTFRYLRKSNN